MRLTPKTSPLAGRVLTGALFVAGLTLATGCQEEQVLYRAEGPTPIPPVPEEPRAAQSDFAAIHGGAVTAPPAFELPEPTTTTFDATAPEESFRTVALEGMRARVPMRYRATPSPSDMRLVQYDVPAPEGTGLPDGELVVFHFGEGQGGGVRENVLRWAGQFQPPEGAESPISRLERGTVDGLTVTRVTLEGQYAPGAMTPGTAPPGPQDDWAMDALVVEGGSRGNLYIRLAGPRPMVGAEDAVMEYMAGSLERDAAARPAAAPPPAHDHAHDHDHDDQHDHSQEGGVALVQAPGVAFAIPANWEPLPATTSMRALEFRVPGPGGDGELTVFYFGRDGGGSAQGNIERWISQVRQPDGSSSASAARVTEQSVGRYRVSRVDVEGTYRATAPGPGAPAPEPQENHGLIGAVVEGGPEGSVFIRFTGPVETVRANEGVMDALLASLREP